MITAHFRPFILECDPKVTLEVFWLSLKKKMEWEDGEGNVDRNKERKKEREEERNGETVLKRKDSKIDSKTIAGVYN